MGVHQISAAQAEALIHSAADTNGERLFEAAKRILDAAIELEVPNN
jgi:hypothetical protein